MAGRFSDRIGATVPRSIVQIGSMDVPLRTAIWNDLSFCLDLAPDDVKSWFWTARWVASHEFDLPTDTPKVVHSSRQWLRETMLESASWYEVYNVIEYLAERMATLTKGKMDEENFVLIINGTLVRHMAGYRFIGGVLTPISDEREVATIHEALENAGATDRFRRAREHLDTALTLISKKPTPDYRNSMKESISAVESAVRSMPGITETNFRAALKKLSSQMGIHPVLEGAFTKLYEYTSDEDGVRHAMVDEPNVGFDEAKFLLVACAGFINFLVAKSAKQPTKSKRPEK